jgi:hypothetical protein
MLEELFEDLEDPAATARWDAEIEFLQEHVFRGLTDLKPAFDSPLIAHFRAADFLRVIARCDRIGILMNGVEIFGPWRTRRGNRDSARRFKRVVRLPTAEIPGSRRSIRLCFV